MIWATMGVNTWCNANSVSFKSHSIRVTFKICAVLCAQGICATGFRHAQGNQHCAKFESYTNRVTFETNAISITSSIHALNLSTYLYATKPRTCYTETPSTMYIWGSISMRKKSQIFFHWQCREDFWFLMLFKGHDAFNDVHAIKHSYFDFDTWLGRWSKWFW